MIGGAVATALMITSGAPASAAEDESLVDAPPTTSVAISAGSVFMGANTYIGNGPNFMVKAIAEESKVEMPGFFGYMKWSIMFLIPCFVITTLIFF